MRDDLQLELLGMAGIDESPTPIYDAAVRMIVQLTTEQRLTIVHAPMTHALLKAADMLDRSHAGKGSYVVPALMAEFVDIWERLVTLPSPLDAPAENDFDVLFVPALDAAG